MLLLSDPRVDVAFEFKELRRYIAFIIEIFSVSLIGELIAANSDARRDRHIRGTRAIARIM